MALEHDTDSPFAEAVRKIGSQSQTARILGRSQSSIYRRLKSGEPVWDTSVLALEEATGIPRWKFRPDLWTPPAAETAAPTSFEPVR